MKNRPTVNAWDSLCRRYVINEEGLPTKLLPPRRSSYQQQLRDIWNSTHRDDSS